MNSNSEKVQRQFLKPALAGAAGAGIMSQLSAQDYSKINIMGKAVNKNLFYFGLFASASFLAEISHNWIFPHISASDKSSELVSAAVSAGLMGGASVAGAEIFQPKLKEVEGVSKLFAIGVATEIASDYFYSNYIEPMLA